MNNRSKIQLSHGEKELVKNASIILTKNEILEKAVHLLAELLEEQQIIAGSLRSRLPDIVFSVSPKISKGENYRGLPWRVLDYPRYFEGDNHFAIRSMIWWGHFFSITLQLSGTFKQQYESHLIKQWSRLSNEGFFISVNDTPWEHHFEEGNYQRIVQMDTNKLSGELQSRHFIKLARKLPIENWNESTEWFIQSYREILTVLVD